MCDAFEGIAMVMLIYEERGNECVPTAAGKNITVQVSLLLLFFIFAKNMFKQLLSCHAESRSAGRQLCV